MTPWPWRCGGAAQAGWTFTNASTFADEKGISRPLTHATPQHVRRAATDAAAAARANTAYAKAAQRGVGEGGGSAVALWTAPLRRAMAANGATATNRLKRAMLMRAATGATWTAKELRERGRQIEAVCKACGEHEDSVWHRVWERSSHSTLRSETFRASTIASALAASGLRGGWSARQRSAASA